MQTHGQDPRHPLIQESLPSFFQILVVDDDLLIHKSIKMALPPQWKMTSATKMEEIPQNRFFHASCVDMHLSKDLTLEPDGPKIVQKLR
ncbi:MAG: hypothetical protein ACK5P5_05015, partial [Pseudobdellovibrionaceae bacterium]